MKKLNVVILLFGILLSNCASVKLTEKWASEDFSDTKLNKLLVVARSNDFDVRKVYEDELVASLKKQGVDAVAAYVLFPDLKESDNRSQKETNDILSMFDKNGIKSIMLTALKDTKVEKALPENTVDYESAAIKGKYGISFTDYYNVHSIEYIGRNLKPVYNDDENGFDLSSTTYVLESVVYDLTLDNKKQLVGVYEIEAIDPSSAKQVLNKFTAIIAKQFKH